MASIDRARAYLAKLPPAIAGQRGHAATFSAACRLVEFGLNETGAWELLCDWNRTHCQPPWAERDLHHKLADAFCVTSPKEHFLESAFEHRTFPLRAVKRLVLPALHCGSVSELVQLAELRGLSREGVALASEKGLLRFGEYRKHPVWFILDNFGRVAQARRMDGSPWAQGVKAWTLPGSQGAWPVGIGEAAEYPALVLCEGGPDLLAACHFLWAEDRERDCAPVTMLGGCASIHADALPMFAGKRVRIFRHTDTAGEDAANRWAEQLADADADVDAFHFEGLRRADGQPVKDLNDLATIHADDFEAHRCLWELFAYARHN